MDRLAKLGVDNSAFAMSDLLFQIPADRTGLRGGAPAQYPMLKNSIFRVESQFRRPPEASMKNSLGVRGPTRFAISDPPTCPGVRTIGRGDATRAKTRFPRWLNFRVFSTLPSHPGRLELTHAVVFADYDSRLTRDKRDS